MVLPVIAAALLAVMAIALRDRAFQPARADSAVASGPAFVATDTTGARLASETTAAAQPISTPPKAPPVVAPEAETAGSKVPVLDSAGAPSVTLLEVAAAMDSAALIAAGLQRRWTTDWSKMHLGPHNESPVVRILPPGTEVHVAQNKWGWWAILWKGDTVGYVAGALLRPTRPYR